MMDWKTSLQRGLPLLLSLALGACSQPSGSRELAERILGDSTLSRVDSMARAVIGQGLNAGSGYSQIWAREQTEN